MMIALGVISTLTVQSMGAEALRDSQVRGDALQAAVNELEAFLFKYAKGTDIEERVAGIRRRPRRRGKEL